MGYMKDLAITYMEIVEEYVASDYTSNAERRIWDTIGKVSYDYADALTDIYRYDAAIYAIENGKIPHNNPAWQELVVRLAYNAIHDAEAFAYYLEHTPMFDRDHIQKMLDLAAFTILAHKNFTLQKFETIS